MDIKDIDHFVIDIINFVKTFSKFYRLPFESISKYEIGNDSTRHIGTRDS